ncbi:hypothetical protein SDC9_74167 [bioreactor metagenome]|uniref:Uncharacterized protein n=1 Tax=bioreactor metagenome TaxID=1076179 RepID=A0A644YNJ1_9ZZZZ
MHTGNILKAKLLYNSFQKLQSFSQRVQENYFQFRTINFERYAGKTSACADISKQFPRKYFFIKRQQRINDMFNGYFFRFSYCRKIHNLIGLNQKIKVHGKLFQLFFRKFQSSFFSFTDQSLQKSHFAFSLRLAASRKIIKTLTSAGDTPEIRDA